MKVSTHQGKKRVTIDPGEFYVTGGDEIISTLLGSCVAACLWDPVSRIIGMNHFLLATPSNPGKTPLILSESGRYGIHAMELLINAMLQHGAERRRLQAKVFGGGNVLKLEQDKVKFFDIGQLNSTFIREFLETEKIPLVASSLGGDFGRVIHFAADDYSVYMKRIVSAAQNELIQQEKTYLQRQLKVREALKSEAKSRIQVW